MKFVFFSQKSAANKQKHGIDFVEAQELWGDWDLLEIPTKIVEDIDFPAWVVEGLD